LKHFGFYFAGNQIERPSFQGYRTQNEQPQRDGNMGQQNYSQPTVNGSDMANHYQGMGVRHEEAVFNPRGPGRGGRVSNKLVSYFRPTHIKQIYLTEVCFVENYGLLASQQALMGRRVGRKQELAQCLRNLNFCVEKVDANADWRRFNLLMTSSIFVCAMGKTKQKWLSCQMRRKQTLS